MKRHRVRIPIPALLYLPEGRHIPVTLPVGAILIPSSRPSATLFGMVGVYWEGRHYSIYPKDLVRDTDIVDHAR